MRAYELNEVRSKTLKYFMDAYPNIPEYVVRDFIYKNYKDDPKGMDYELGLWLNDLKWHKETITVTLDLFDHETQRMLEPRIQGKRLQFVDKDDERHDVQLGLLKKRGVSKEPIIITKAGDEYELQEGWHRVAQSLSLWPEGYEQIAWIGEE